MYVYVVHHHIKLKIAYLNYKHYFINIGSTKRFVRFLLPCPDGQNKMVSTWCQVRTISSVIRTYHLLLARHQRHVCDSAEIRRWSIMFDAWCIFDIEIIGMKPSKPLLC